LVRNLCIIECFIAEEAECLADLFVLVSFKIPILEFIAYFVDFNSFNPYFDFIKSSYFRFNLLLKTQYF
jgi:hypothetical protein